MAERSRQLWAGGRSRLTLDGQCKSRGDGRGPLSLRVHGFPQVNPDTGYINYDQLEENARLFHPKLIIAGDERAGSRGGSSQSRASGKAETVLAHCWVLPGMAELLGLSTSFSQDRCPLCHN